MFILFYVFLFLHFVVCSFGNASILTATNDVGSYLIVLVFNNETITTDKVMLTSYDITNKVVYFQTVADSSTVGNILCRISSQKRVIWGPCGCSNIDDPSQALQSANCIADNVNIELYRRLFSENWYKSKLSELCAVPGDVRICSGPMRLAIENRDPYFDYKSYSTEDLLRSRMVFITGLTGPMGKSPYTVRMNMVMPAITAHTNCNMPPGITYEGTYSNYELDPNTGMITIVWKVFKNNENTYQRILLRRTDPFGIKFSIVLANVIAGAGEYNLDAWSDPIASSLEFSERLFLDWVQSIEWNKTYTMTTNSGTCSLRLTIPSELSYNLIKPYLVTPFNYTDNVNPKTLYTNSVCNICYGRYDIVGYLVCPDTPEGGKGGGYIKYVYPGDVELPVFVPANPNLDYRFDCDEAYPRASFFFDVNGVRWERMDLDITEMCYFPMYYLGDDIQEKGRQCQLKGGFTWTKAQTLCARPITSLFCKIGWIYFDGKCFWKFDPSLDGQYASPLDQANLICTQLNSFAQPIVEMDQDLANFLLRDYIYWKRNLDFPAAYRVPVYGQPYCRCFLTYFFTEVQCPCYNIVYDQTIQIFPICFYYTSVKALEPLYADVQVSIETARVWRYGQEGPDMGAYEATCVPFDGWKDKGANTVTCPLKDIINDARQNTTLVEYFRKCYKAGGSCFNGQSRLCQCPAYRGPSSSLLSTLTELYQYKDLSCGCPGGVKTSGVFQINDNVYNGSSLYVPCTDIQHGICIYTNNTGIGYCACTQRENLVYGGLENGYNGQGCGCRVPVQTVNSIGKNGPIVIDFCNGHGTCCPFGETVHDREGNLYKAVCFDRRTSTSFEGCVGDNGWGGPADTCPTPFDVVGIIRWQSFNNGFLYYKDLGSKTLVNYVRVEGCGDMVSIFLSDEVGKSSSTIACDFRKDLGVWYCPTLEGYQFVVASNITLSDDCDVEAYKDFFNYCGFNYTTNPFAAQFFNIPAYRGPNKNLEDQKAEVAFHGCTSTDCMCNSNYTGFHCNTGVSSIRYIMTDTANVLSQLVCGESVADANLEDPVAGRGFIDVESGNCSCNTISNVDVTGASGMVYQYFVGKACECPMLYNWDRDNVMLCGGHGRCELANFPYGECSVDMAKYRADALYYPFVPKKSIDITFVNMQAQGDAYFLYTPGQSQGTKFPTSAPTNPTKSPTKPPTENPTHQPTKTPTKAPTRNPTNPPTLPPVPQPTKNPTKSPTKNPTKAPTRSPKSPTVTPPTYVIRIFDSQILADGSINGMGWEGLQEQCENVAANQGLNCVNTIPFLWNGEITSYEKMLEVLQGKTGTRVFGYGNFDLGSYYSILLKTPPPTITLAYSLQQAGVFPDVYDEYWTGIAGYDCLNWTSNVNTDFGVTGSTTSTTAEWVGYQLRGCDAQYIFPCVCKDYIVTPTSSPNTSPSKTPTKAPTIFNPRVIWFNSNQPEKGDIGDQGVTDDICATEADRLGLTCRVVVSNLEYTDRKLVDFPTLYNFPPETQVVGPTGLSICTYDTCYASTSPDRSLADAGVAPSSAPTAFWIGIGLGNCLDWTSHVSTDTGDYASTISTDPNWYDQGGTTCSEYHEWGCSCIQGKASHTFAPTTGNNGVYWFDSGQINNGIIGTSIQTDGICSNRAAVLGLTCDYVFSNLFYSYRPIYSPPQIPDPDFTPVYSTSEVFICFYSDCYPSSHSMVNSLTSAGVFPNSSPTRVWLGIPSTCNDWTATSGTAPYGSTNSAAAMWFQQPVYQSCTTASRWYCNCVHQFTASPIKSPTLKPTTKIPTRNPTAATPSPSKSPTLKPTKRPTVSPTRNPTRPPTKNPTTKFPTKAPTLAPTNPTSSPTLPDLENRDIQYLYRLTSGGTVSIYNVFYNITLTHLRSAPVNMTINPVGSFIRPVLWTNLVYRRFNPSTLSTETVTIDACNPGTPSWIPGQYQIQPDGIKTCPTIDKCILTVDCTDNLTPSITTTPMSGFPDLRACWCTHSEIVYSTVAALDPITTLNVHLFEGSLGLQQTVVIPSDSFSSFYCNGFIDRTINCMFRNQDPQYFFRCSDEPIGCYDFTIGRFFGAFNRQNPKFNYPLDQKEWTLDHYRGVASVMNNLTYLKDNQFADPFTSDIWNRYYWIKINETGSVLTLDVDINIDVYQTSLLQGFPYMDILTDIPPPPLERKITITAVDNYQACYDGFTSLCRYLNWTNPDFPTPVGRMPGSYSFIQSTNITYLSFTFKSKSSPGNKRITGVEIYNSLNLKCGGVYRDNGFKEGEIFTISCLSLPTTNTIFQDAEFSIRFLGLNSIYDLPGGTLNSQYFHSPYDPLIPYLDLLYYDGVSQTLVLPLSGLYDKGVTNVNVLPANPFNWPQRQWNNDTLMGDVGFTVTANYTFTADGQTVTNAWSEIANLITNNNIYPENLPLREVQANYNTAPTNFADPYVLDYLYEIWAVWLYERKCGGSNYDCETSQLGECVIETEFNQVWWNIGNVVNYEPIGKEGGCNCNHDFVQGYYNFPLLCGACEYGFAPFTLNDMSLIIQYNSLVSKTYNPGFLPVGVTDISVDLFESTYSCRYPSGYDPVPSSLAPINFCAGHGVLSGANTTQSNKYSIWDGKYYISCASLASDEFQFSLSYLTTSQYSQIYADGNTLLTIVGSPYDYDVNLIEGNEVTSCALAEEIDVQYPFPFRMIFFCSGRELILTCQNDKIFTTNDVHAFRDIFYTKNPFISYVYL